MDADELLDTRRYYSRIGLWPAVPAEAKPQAWLQNFNSAEMPYALSLLDAFLFFNSAMTDKLFISAFHNLSHVVCSSDSTYAAAGERWTRFLNAVLVTHPTGETPSVTDSGYMFDRKARQLLEIGEPQILSPEDALALIAKTGDQRPLVFVDDFAGSGDQFTETWNRAYALSDGTSTSLSGLNDALHFETYYVPAVATWRAIERVRDVAPSVQLMPAHILPSPYSALDPASILFPPDLVKAAPEVIRQATVRAGVHPDDVFGWKRLGLAVGFEHSVPDATLPIFWVDTPGWTPLVRRR